MLFLSLKDKGNQEVEEVKKKKKIKEEEYFLLKQKDQPLEYN